MDASAKLLTQQDNLLASDMLGVFFLIYFLLAVFLFVSFINIYSMDQYEFQNNLQSCFEFKRKMFFIISFSRHKTIISKKTFVLEIIGYFLALMLCVSFVISLGQKVETAHFLLVFPVSFIIPFAIAVGIMYNKLEKHKNR